MSGRPRVAHYFAPPPDEASRPLALTVNPLSIILGRLSGNVELLVAPHHAFIVSPNLLIGRVGRGGPNSLVSQAYGFATESSGGIGVEIGYHYWWHRRAALRGLFVGPSILLGSTTQASVGDPSHAQTYAGLALDAGVEEVFPGGFTLGGGAGAGLIRMADTTAVFPRFLLQLGWSL